MTGEGAEYVRGQWIRGGTEDEPDAVVAYGADSGWVWWARGKNGRMARMGEATSYEAACRAAEDALARMGA